MSSSVIRVTAGPVVAGGDALVRRTGEKVMFVEGALPGEVVDVEVVAEHKQMVNARVVDVVEASPSRVQPTCALFHDNCGGCQWNFIDIATQHALKTDIVRDALTRIAKLEHFDLAFEAGVTPTGYRTTMRMATKDGRPGMRRLHTNEVLAPLPCTITHRLLHDAITQGHYNTAEVTLRASESTGDVIAVVNANDASSIVEHVNGHDFVVSAQSFFQSGPEAAGLLSELVDNATPLDARWIVDAYAGIGLFGAALAAKRNCRITAIEQSPFAVADARKNLSAYDAEVIEAEVAQIELFDDDAPDVVIADPSRTGLGKSAAQALAQLAAPKFVLISCDPASMARDVGLLHGHGYQLDSVRVLDLFPQTPHVETVAVFNLG